MVERTITLSLSEEAWASLDAFAAMDKITVEHEIASRLVCECGSLRGDCWCEAPEDRD